MKSPRFTLRAASLAACGLLSYQASAVQVGLELALLVDVSGSVSTTEYNLQKQGYANAFQTAAVQNLISQVSGGIAVTYIEWSGASQQAQLVGWSHLTGAASANAFASAILATSRAFSGSTEPDDAINYAVPKFSNNGFEGTYLVIDVSGDGTGNVSATQAARDNALNNGITRINGLAIGGASITTWYNANIKGGTDAFVIGAATFNDFENAIIQKLTFEIGDAVPDGGPGLLLLGGIGTLLLRRRHAQR